MSLVVVIGDTQGNIRNRSCIFHSALSNSLSQLPEWLPCNNVLDAGRVSCPLLFNTEEVHGSSFYGAGTIAGLDGKRTPSDLEKAVRIVSCSIISRRPSQAHGQDYVRNGRRPPFEGSFHNFEV